ncbi:Aristolochene synthase from penicillium Roqueforti [Xylaria flabelliformis]|nr:Aristolochene synthase from penicillium Roqueforti [Xylaria flabelliformis]
MGAIPNDPVPHWGLTPPSKLKSLAHPSTKNISLEVNGFFLKHWPFPSELARKKFLRSDFSLATSYNCPHAKEDRLIHACKLITTVFLIDDILETMSLADGTAYNAKLVPVCRGEVLPNRNDAVEWILYDLFEEMRAKDKVLADECLEPTFEFLRSQTEDTRKHVSQLAPYLDYRYRDIGQTIISGLIKYCMELHLTAEEHELMIPLEKNSGKHLTIVNDIFSWEKEVKASKELHSEGAILCSSLKIVMDETGINVHGAKRLLWLLAREVELKQEDLQNEFLATYPSCSGDPRRYMRELEYLMAGNEQWSKETVRYTELD